MDEPVEVLDRGEATLTRRLVAEFVGTVLLVAVGAGAATALALGPSQRLAALDPNLVGPNRPVFELLIGNSFGDLLGVALAFTTILAVLVYAFGGVSGGHFNPAVTFALASTGRFKWVEVPMYWVAQCLGGIGGAFVIAGIYSENGNSIGNLNILFGGTTVAPDVSTWHAILAEAVITYILVTAIMAIAVDPRAPKGWSGLVIGLGLGAGILLTGAATGGSANFARSLGPFVAAQFGPGSAGSIPWNDLIVYAVGPLIGGAAAALVYESVAGLETVSPPPHPGAATPASDEPDEGAHEAPPPPPTYTPPPAE
jgi:glycerol uptake facilitator protein